jgi:hypothetical protein
MTRADRDFQRATRELELTRRRRELLFWTVRSWIGVIVLVGVSMAGVIALVRSGGALDTSTTLLLASASSAGLGASARRRRR